MSTTGDTGDTGDIAWAETASLWEITYNVSRERLTALGVDPDEQVPFRLWFGRLLADVARMWPRVPVQLDAELVQRFNDEYRGVYDSPTGYAYTIEHNGDYYAFLTYR